MVNICRVVVLLALIIQLTAHPSSLAIMISKTKERKYYVVIANENGSWGSGGITCHGAFWSRVRAEHHMERYRRELPCYRHWSIVEVTENESVHFFIGNAACSAVKRDGGLYFRIASPGKNVYLYGIQD